MMSKLNKLVLCYIFVTPTFLFARVTEDIFFFWVETRKRWRSYPLGKDRVWILI
jgi:hypothetical protein